MLQRRDLALESPTTRRALRELWGGRRLVVVSSPPGAGKTRLITVVTSELARRRNAAIVIATPTRSQAVSIAARMAEIPNVSLSMSSPPEVIPDGVTLVSKPMDPAPGHIVIRTVASTVAKPPVCDLMVIDESYQATYLDVVCATQNANALLTVGDPGQIGPVITIDPSIFENCEFQPAPPAPTVLAAHPQAVNLVFDATYRLGPETTSVVRHLYPFSFSTRRPDRGIAGTFEVEAVDISPASSPYDQSAVSKISARVAALIGKEIVESGQVVGVLDQSGVAVILSHNAQCAAVTSRLASDGLSDVTVGTADRLQGGEWPAVVALDPMFGYLQPSPHSSAAGRLCVMVSRHTHHLTWIGPRGVTGVLAADTEMDPGDMAAAIEVREQIWSF